MNTKDIIEKLQLKPHPEGGYFKETYRCSQQITTNEGKIRNVSTAVYYLLGNDDKSFFHRIQSDELWHFHQGEPLEIFIISERQLVVTTLGNQIDKGEVPQAVVPAQQWFAARVKNSAGYSLVTCTVAPGFDFTDFELAKKETLLKEYPHLRDIIETFTNH